MVTSHMRILMYICALCFVSLSLQSLFKEEGSGTYFTSRELPCKLCIDYCLDY